MARTGALALAAALLVVAAKASYDEPTFGACRKSDDCVGGDNADDKTTICRNIDSVTVAATATEDAETYNWGFCVQCTTNTDCNPNEWCAPAMKVSSKWWNDAEFARMSEAQQKTRQTMLDSWSNGEAQVQGKCVEYGSFSDAEAEIVGRSCTNNVNDNSPSNDPEIASDMAACSFVYSWQPEFYTCVGDTCPGGADDQTLKNPGFHSPGACTAKVSRGTGENAPASCSGGVGWTGSCIENKCQICKDSAGANGNIDRVCIGNAYDLKAFSDSTARTIAGNVSGQLLLVLVVFSSIMAVIACLGCIYTCKTGSAAAKA